LDYEVELGFFIAGGNAMGRRVAIERAEDRLFDVTLFNGHYQSRPEAPA
jgi:fumarylacetoacetase